MTKCIVAAAVMQLLEEIGKQMTRNDPFIAVSNQCSSQGFTVFFDCPEHAN